MEKTRREFSNQAIGTQMARVRRHLNRRGFAVNEPRKMGGDERPRTSVQALIAEAARSNSL